MSELIVALGRYEELTLHSTPCGEYVDFCHICDNGCDDVFECVAGRNFLQEIEVI